MSSVVSDNMPSGDIQGKGLRPGERTRMGGAGPWRHWVYSPLGVGRGTWADTDGPPGRCRAEQGRAGPTRGLA